MNRYFFPLLLSSLLLSQSFAAPEVAVRKGGQDGVNTYRIPGLNCSNKGTLLAVWDNRIDSAVDLQGNIDIGLCRSLDGGQTWLPLQTVLDMGEWGDLPEKFNGVSDASVTVDRVTGRIWVAGLWMYGVLDGKGQWTEGLTESSKNWVHQWHARGSQAGFDPKQTSQFILSYSDDDGATWSEPINITEKTKREEWWLFAPAPGAGITLKDGTIVLPTQGRDAKGKPFSNITYSKDRGETWVTSNPAHTNTTECAVVELPDGRLMLNMRDNRNSKEKGDKNGRAIFTTSDLGQTWQEHETSNGALIEPVCMASLHRHDYKGQTILFFCNPNTKEGRRNMTIQYSLDDGKTWNVGPMIDGGYSYGYSCITSVDENTIGVLWEGSRSQMAFRAISIADILEGKKPEEL